jgi:hypothetical protein
MKTCTRPTYYAVPYRLPASKGNPKLIPGRFSIYELRDGKTELIVEGMSNSGDRLNNILKRGIPLDDAKELFYQMEV